MSTTIPQTMKALVASEQKGSATVREVPVPQLDDNEVLIKVQHAAQNPTDWKHEAFFSPKDAIIGCDYAGTVVKLGNNLASPLQVGDKVAGWVHGGLFPNKGSYAEYAKQESDLLFKVPESISLKEASHFGCAWLTALQVILYDQKNDFPPTKVDANTWYLVYGASTSVGLFAVQLAKSIGYKVVGVCSERNFDLVKSYGADEVVDYRDGAKAKEDIKRITNGGVNIGLDCISEGDSFDIALGGFKKGEKGRLNALLPPSDFAKNFDENIHCDWTLAYTVFGKAFDNPFTGGIPLPANKDERAFAVKAFAKTPEFINNGIKPNPVHDMGGLDTVKDGFEHQKSGKVSAKKITYTYA